MQSLNKVRPQTLMIKSTSRQNFTSLQKCYGIKQNPLTKLVKALSAYDPADLLAAVAGLQLMPENADRAVRFEVLAHAVASIKGFGSKPSVNLKQLEKICNNSPELMPFIWMEDPLANPFTEAFTFYGGSYIVFPGIAEESTFIWRQLTNAIFLHPEPFPDYQFARIAHQLFLAVLVLSNEIARRAGLERGVEPITAPGDNVVIPAVQRLAKLKKAVSFSWSELSNLLGIRGTSFSILEQLILPLGTVSLANYQIDNGELLARPIVQTADGFVVAIPGMLLSSARNELIRLALERGVKDELVERYSDAVWRTVVDSMDYIDNHLTPVPLPNAPNIPHFQEAIFGFDVDKAVYVALLTDSLDEYDVREPFGEWSLDGIATQLEVRIQEICEYAFTTLTGINEVLFLLVVQSFGRWRILGFNQLPEVQPFLWLSLTASALETITLLEAGQPLALWNYAWASWRLEQQAEVVSMSGELDKFHLYWKNKHSFYFSDDKRPNMIVPDLSGSGELHRELLNREDRHAVLSYNQGYVTEVISRSSTREVPIYFPKSILSRVRQPPALLVEGLALPIWIIGSELEDENQQELRGLYKEFVEAIAYWLWQFIPSLSPILQSLFLEHQVIIIQLFLLPDEAWHRITEPKDIPNQVLVNIQANSSSGILDVTISSDVSSLLERSDNSGERLIMQHILSGLRELLPSGERANLSDDVITTIIENHAPLGIKKKLLFLSLDTNPELDNSGLPRYRKVQADDEDELLDELGNYLSSVEKLKEGVIPDDKRTNVLNKTVKFFYRELEKLVASLNPEGLLKYLIAYHEAIVHEVAEHRLTIPTRLACFSSESGMVEKLSEELPERHKAALTSRFVIEYVVARPPVGIRPFSLSVYDRLQALASEIINFGFESDLINFSLADLKLAMLPSGRLGTDREQYEKTRDAYMFIFTGGEIVRATREFGRYWKKPKAATEKPTPVNQFDAAATIEFGFSITELQEVLGIAMNIGRNIHPSVAILPLKELIARLTNQLGWTRERVGQALNLLSLKPRSDFLKPDPPFKAADVFPWKFNRSLSYLRRPFLHRERNGEVEVLWGIRHLNTVSQYLIYLSLNGRLKAQSKEMKQVMGELRNIEGEKFNDQVADLLEQSKTLIVRRRVKKIGKLEIKGEKGTLGDIDVLAADSQRKRLIVIECKNFALARAPHEMANELAELFQGRGKEKSAVQHHQERVDWLCSHLQEVLTWLGLDSTANWKVEPLIVTDYELATPHLWSSPIPVVSLVELSKALLEKSYVSVDDSHF